MSLSDKIQLAITSVNIDKLREYKDICNILHTGENSLEYTPSDMPSDSIYETIVRMTRDSEEVEEFSTMHGTTMWMGTIPKPDQIVELENALVMPKFNGNSCGIKLIREGIKFILAKAHTRGKDIGFSRKNLDITQKLSLMPHFVKTLEELNSVDPDYILPNGLIFNEIMTISMRGELVVFDKNISESPESYVAGKLKINIDEYMRCVDTIEFIPFEISDISTIDMSIVPTQFDAGIILRNICGIEYPCKILDKLTEENIRDTYYEFADELNEPIDGVVYVNQDWTYPKTEADTKKSVYGKYAWKPFTEFASKLENIEYSVDSLGKYSMEFIYTPTKANGKTYTRAKVAIKSFIEKLRGIGIGSTMNITLNKLTCPYINEYIPEEDIVPYELITECVYCGNTLKTRKTKTTILLICDNNMCKGRLVQRWIHFLKMLQIKGVSDKKINKFDDICAANIISKLLVNIRGNTNLNRYSFVETIKLVDIRTLLIALGYGGAKQVEKLVPSIVSPGALALLNLDVIWSIIGDDAFARDIITAIRIL
jgi:hypothetical protein